MLSRPDPVQGKPAAKPGQAPSKPTGQQDGGGSLSKSLQPLLKSDTPEISVGDMMERIEDSEGPGPVIFMLTLPVLMPMPPGVSMVLALPLLMVAPQVVLGRKRLWMPKWLSKREVKHKELVKTLGRVMPLLKKFEAHTRPRLKFLTGSVGARVVGVACSLIAVILVLPIPFANLLPAIALGVFSMGLARRDGLLVLAGYSLLAAAAWVIYLGVHGFSFGLGYLKSLF